MILANLVHFNIFNVFPEYFLGISVLSTLAVIILSSYSGLWVYCSKSFKRIYSLSFITHMFFKFKKQFRTIKKRKSYFDQRFFASYEILHWPGKLCKLRPFWFSVFFKTVKHFMLDVYLLLVVDVSKILVFFRFILVFVVIILSSPDYTFCMEVDLTDSNNFSSPDIQDKLSALSNAEVTLKKCEADLTSISDSDLNERNIQKTHRKVNKMLSTTRIVANEISGIETNSYAKMSDFNFRLNHLKQIAGSQQPVVSNHNSILDPTDSSLWKDLQKYQLTSIFTAATAATGVVLTLAVILVRSPKNF